MRARSSDGLRAHWPALALAAVAAVGSVLVQRLLFPRHSGNSDEAVYRFQADLLLHGQVTVPMSTWSPFFRPWLSGEHDGNYFVQYQPGFPAVLALGDLVLGSAGAGLALVSALLVVGAYGLGWELGGSRRSATLAGVAVAFSPLFVIHSGLFLPYGLTTAMLLIAVASWLRLRRTGSWPSAVVTGMALGGALLTRPFDAVLVGVPLVVATLVVHRRTPSVALRSGAWIAVGAAPAIAITLLFNWRTTGSPVRFPLPATEPTNTFGFGLRRILPDQSPVDYSVTAAVAALRDNLLPAHHWLLGGLVAVGLCLWAVAPRVDGRDVGRRLVFGLALLFPFGYFFWWATAWSAEGAADSLGPHYYVPALAFVAVLAGVGLDGLLDRSRWALLAVPLGLLLTLPFVPAKIDSNRFITDYFARVEASIVTDPARPAVVLTKGDEGKHHLWIPWPFLRNGVDLDDRVLYAADQGPANATLAERFPDRDLFRLRREIQPGDSMFWPFVRFEPIRVVQGRRVEVTIRFTNRTLHIFERPFVRRNGVDVVAVELAAAGERDKVIRFAIEAGMVPPDGAEFAVGVELADRDGQPDPEVFERRFDVAPAPGAPGRVAIVVPGVGWHRLDLGSGPTWLRENIDPLLAEVSVVAVDG